jgi:hypothetical protein
MPRVTPFQSFLILLGLAWLLLSLQLLLQNWAATANAFADPDDAMRLVQVRAFMAGQGWFDLNESRLAPPLGYPSHWSRLIDAPLAGLLLIFGQFTDADFAVRLVRTVWPLMWLLPAIGGIAAVSWRIGGREAALVALLMAVLGLPALQQFKPGRIDHHNVQIALTMLVVAATVWSGRVAWAGTAAGLISALALTIGFECLPFIALCGAALALRFVADADSADALRRYGLSLAAGILAGFLVAHAPRHWTRTACDVLDINMALPLVVTGVILAAAGFARGSLPARLGLVGAAGVAALGLFVMLEPRCLGGPFAFVDPVARLTWLSHVSEMTPVWKLLDHRLPIAAAMLTFPALGLVASLTLLRRAREDQRAFAIALTVTLLVAAFLLTLGAIRMCHYAMAFAMPVVAAAVVRVTAWLRLDSLALRVFAAFLFTPAVVVVGAVLAAEAAGFPASNVSFESQKACFKGEGYAPLARLPKGVVATDVDHGPFVLVFTPHAVLSAPYHRRSDPIVATHDLLDGPVEAAPRVVERYGITYVALCARQTRAAPGSLRERLRDGDPPAWLERVPATAGEAFPIYRVRAF